MSCKRGPQSVSVPAAIWLSGLLLMGAPAQQAACDEPAQFIPPATPLVACDPYFSIWSAGKTLTEVPTTHWTGRQHRLTGLVRIDGKTYRVMGAEPAKLPALEQTGLRITPTRSIYEFQGAGVKLQLTFTTPSLPEDIDLLSRPITYLTISAQSGDGARHKVQAYVSAAAEIAVNEPDQQVAGSTEEFGPVVAQKIGATEQFVLGKTGDDMRIDWGYLYLAARRNQVAANALGAADELAERFASGQSLPAGAAAADQPAEQLAAAVALQPMEVGRSPAEQFVLLAYDDLYSIEFMMKPLRPYWRRNGLDAAGLLTEAVRDYASLRERCERFDERLTADLERIGGAGYAQIGALAYRQCFAAGKFVADDNGQPIQFCKENNSNGCIGTSDVFYPMAPQFLLFGPSLAKSFVAPFMEYAKSDRWKFPFAPHDLGTYPKANGQVYGGGERSEENQMPVEESGNILILMAAIAKLEGNADFASRYWPQLVQWAEYLQKQGFDPDRQLCTDDFAGHLAHNVNLSAKAICGLGAFAQLCELRGDAELALRYRETAKDFAEKWIDQANDGDHFRLAFDKPGTWSQKYNLVWDKVLGLDLFPESVLEKEMAYYRRVQNKYGLPLDNRREYTKLDWVLWTAALTQDREDFDALVRPVYRFLQETPTRVPMTDWYQTVSGKQVGFKARPVVGGVFMATLYDNKVWDHWASRDQTKAGGYAALPRPPRVITHVPAADTEPATWRYTTQQPAGDWQSDDYDDSAWKQGQSGFGTRNTPNATVGTRWNSPNIWLRRTFDLPDGDYEKLLLYLHHDEDAQVYINGKLARRASGFTTQYAAVPLLPEAASGLKAKGNVIAVYCHQTQGGQFIDVGLVSLEEGAGP
ncbi:MAG: DUF4965 domain-containing protein [Planctomycetales bacterium]|nr:DUF4965 domain-containing protein [Planctomycetales bacterium]